MKKFAVLFASLMLVVGMASSAMAAPITSLTVTGGSFSMGFGGPFTVWDNSLTIGGYDGTNPAPLKGSTEADYGPTAVVTFTYGGFGPVQGYTAPYDDVPNGPFPGVTGDIHGGLLDLDLSSWTYYWNGTNFNMGAVITNAPIDNAGNFTVEWDATVIGGPFDGQVGHSILTGVATAVPEPSSLLLIGSGLLGLIGLARKRG